MLKRTITTDLVSCAIAFVLLAVVPSVITTNYYIHLATLALIFFIVAAGQNVIQGYTGYVSIAQGGLMGCGAYASALLALKQGWPVWCAIPLAAAVTGLAGVIIGALTLRSKGHYFAIVTMAYNLVIFIVLMNWQSLTGGEAGLAAIPRPEPIRLGDVAIAFQARETFYYLTLTIAVLVQIATILLIRSRVGDTLLAIKGNEALAQGIGIDVARHKIAAFAFSAVTAGLAGALYAHFIKFINPSPFGLELSLNAILAVILGGSGTLWGPAIGAFIVTFLPEYLRVAETYRLIAYGLILVLATIFLPRGLGPYLVRGFGLLLRTGKSLAAR